jgi:hypothetical protein
MYVYIPHITKCYTESWTGGGSVEGPIQQYDIRLGTWNVGFSENISELVGVHEIRWSKGSTEPAEDYAFPYGKGNHQLGTGFSVHKKITSTAR